VKYLKLFESFDSAEYREVDLETWNRFGKITRFGDSKIDRIEKLIHAKGYGHMFITDKIGTIGAAKELINFVKRDNKLFTKILIVSLEDEWFKVRIETTRKTQVTYDKQYYLCDQFDGLIKFIEEVL
jgi:hypothetical protein